MGFYGRRIELDQLLEERRLARTDARVCVVEGPAGIGKSALLRRFCVELAPEAPVVVEAARAESRPLRSLIDAFGIAETGARSEPGPIGRAIGSDETRRRENAVLDAVEGIVYDRGSAVIVVDDLDTMDAASSALLLASHERLDGLGVLIVGARRSRPETEHLGVSRVISLGGLDEHSLRLLIEEQRLARAGVALDAGARDGDIDAVIAHGGSPLLTIALCQHHRESSMNAASFDAIVSECLARRSSEERTAIQVAALLAASAVSVSEVALLLRVDRMRALRLLRAWEHEGLLVADATGLRFVHDLVRGSVEASVVEPERSAWHGDIASALALRDEPATRVLPHVERCADSTNAERLLWFVRAARSLRTSSHQAAAALYERAWALTTPRSKEWIDVAVELAESLGSCGSLPRAEAIAREALPIAGERQGELGWWLGCVLFLRNRPNESAAVLTHAAALTADPVDRSRVLAMPSSRRYSDSSGSRSQIRPRNRSIRSRTASRPCSQISRSLGVRPLGSTSMRPRMLSKRRSLLLPATRRRCGFNRGCSKVSPPSTEGSSSSVSSLRQRAANRHESLAPPGPMGSTTPRRLLRRCDSESFPIVPHSRSRRDNRAERTASRPLDRSRVASARSLQHISEISTPLRHLRLRHVS